MREAILGRESPNLQNRFVSLYTLNGLFSFKSFKYLAEAPPNVFISSEWPFLLYYPKYFAKQLTTTLKRTNSRVTAFLKDPDADNVHDLRTSIRRTEALLRLLPKNLRTRPEVITYLRNAKDVFRATTEIRDIDITSVGLSKFKSVEGMNELLASNEKKRTFLLRKARKCSAIYQKMNVLRIESAQLSQRKLEKRRKKILRRLKDSLIAQSKLLLSDRDPEKLHELRKTCKQMRYSLEIDSKDQKKLKETLVQVQKILGTFMDIHSTLRYTSSSSIAVSAKQIISELESDEVRAYESSVDMLKQKLLPAIKNLSA